MRASWARYRNSARTSAGPRCEVSRISLGTEVETFPRGPTALAPPLTGDRTRGPLATRAKTAEDGREHVVDDEPQGDAEEGLESEYSPRGERGLALDVVWRRWARSSASLGLRQIGARSADHLGGGWPGAAGAAHGRAEHAVSQ
jgi:hypothetical protein